ncbi:MAG: tail fiber domain-containing protein [Pirellulales bacterium]
MTAGTFRHSTGPEVTGYGHMLVCDGTIWINVLSYTDAGDLTQLGNQSCNSGDVLQFSSAQLAIAAGSGIGGGLWSKVAGTDYIYFNSGTPRVGIGTSTPTATLDVKSGYSATAFTIHNGSNTAFTITNVGGIGASYVSNGRMTIYGDKDQIGFVNGGFSLPSPNIFRVYPKDFGAGSTLQLMTNHGSVAGTPTQSLEFLSNTGGAASSTGGSVNAAIRNNLDGALKFFTAESTSLGGTATNLREVMRIDSDGNVGIGDLSPDTGTGGQLKLDVAGPIGGTSYCDENGNNCFTAADVGSPLWEDSGTAIRASSSAVDYSALDFVFGSPQLDQDGDSNHDKRMFFDKSKAAFRAGGTIGTARWDSASIGSYSVALGNDTLASGEQSAAWGNNTAASGASATAFGGGSGASGNYSTAFGLSTAASGGGATAFGDGSGASGNYSTAFGSQTTAGGSYSTAWGVYTHAGSYAETSLGRYSDDTAGTTGSWVATEVLFEIGNGIHPFARANALTLLKNGNLAIGNMSPDVRLDVDGDIQYTGTLQDMSDARLKTDVAAVGADAVSAVRRLRPVSFRMTGGSGILEYGFIAQDVQAVLPDLVHEGDDGMLSLNYLGLIAPIVANLQVMDAENDALREENASLRKSITMIEERLAKLEAAGQ